MAQALKEEDYLQPIWEKISNNTPLITRLLDRSTIASASVLEFCEDPDELFLVGNTHLYFHPDADHIRLLQGGIVIYWLKHLKKELMKKVSYYTIFFCLKHNTRVK